MNNNQVMHIILKYNNNVYAVDTINKHRSIIETKGKVVWGIIKPSENSPGVAKDKVIRIKDQISNNIETWAFFVTGGKVKAKGKIADILSKEEVSDKIYLVPEYYHKDLDRCVSGVLLEDITLIDSDIINKFERYGTEGGSVAVGNQTNPLYISLIDDNQSFYKNEKSKELVSNKQWENLKPHEIKEYLNGVSQYINSVGFIYEFNNLCNFYLSLKTKPFVILAGISGTGKSRLTRLFAEALGANTTNERFRMISVKPDWNDSADLFGYKNITDKFIKGVLTEAIEDALKNINLPYFICLDEMNLARVEYYFSEYLSLIESRRRHGNFIVSDSINNGENPSSIENKIYIPENLYIVGTVNMDDTTFGFSRKVLDRANTLEFNDVNLDKLFLENEYLEDKGDIVIHNDFIKSTYLSPQEIEEEYREYSITVNNRIAEINEILKKGKRHFGYRVREEVLYYMVENKKLSLLDENVAFDYQLSQKILPLINGSQVIVKDILVDLFNICIGNKVVVSEVDYLEDAFKNLDNAIYKKSASKIIEMLRGYKYDGFATFWF